MKIESLPTVFSPEQTYLQVSKATIYELINSGEILAKKVGRAYRIPETSLAFFIKGLDEDISKAENIDRTNLERSGITSFIRKLRAGRA